MSAPTEHTPGPWLNDPLQPTIWANDGDLKVATIADLPWNSNKSNWLTEQANNVSTLDFLKRNNPQTKTRKTK